MANTQETLGVAVGEFVSDTDRVGIFVNGNDTAEYTAVDGSKVPSIRKYLKGLHDFFGTSTPQADDAIAVQQPFAGSVLRTQHDKNAECICDADFESSDLAARAAFNARAKYIGNGSLLINPTSGDDFRAACLWCAENDTQMIIDDGVHNLSTYVDISNSKILSLKSKSDTEFITVTGLSYSLVTGVNWSCVVTVSKSLPVHVVVGCGVGFQNVKSENGIEAVNGAHKITSIAADRMSFTVSFRLYGVTPTNPTTMDNALTLGLIANQVVINKTTIIANSSAWDGYAREGFINVFSGAQLFLKGITFIYDGATDEHDMFFAKDAGSRIEFTDRVICVGAGDKIVRAAGASEVYANRSLFGGGSTAQEVYQGVAGSTLFFVRSIFGGVSASSITATSSVNAMLSSCIATNSGGSVCRTTYPDASINVTASKIAHSAVGLQATDGRISVSGDSEIIKCTSPFSVSAGIIKGNPTITSNTNAPIAENVFTPHGGAWSKDLVPIQYSNFKRVGSYTASLDFPSIAAGGYADLTIAATGVAFGDHIMYSRVGATEPAQGIVIQAFASAVDTITVRCFNITASAIDKSAFTARVSAIRIA